MNQIFKADPADQLDREGMQVEAAALGAMLVCHPFTRAWRLAVEDFTHPLNRKVYSILSDASAEGREISPAILAKMMQDEAPVSPTISATAWVRELVISAKDATPTADADLRNFTARRRMLDVGRFLVGNATDHGERVEEIAGFAVGGLTDVIAQSSRTKTAWTLAESGQWVFDHYSAGGEGSFVASGLESVDRMTGGLPRGGLTVLAGRPSMGKSMVAGSLGLTTARRGGGVMIYSLEMTHDALTARFMSDLAYDSEAPIPYTKIQRRELTDDELRRVYGAFEGGKELPIRIETKPALTIAEVAARSRAERNALAARGQKLDLIIVDHIGKARASGRYSGNSVEELGEITGDLAALAKELDCAVLALCQLNRAVEGREDKRPMMGDLRGSGKIEEDADQIWMVYREAYYHRNPKDDARDEADRVRLLRLIGNDLELLVAKQRNGPADTIKLFCDPACNVIRDLAQPDSPEPPKRETIYSAYRQK